MIEASPLRGPGADPWLARLAAAGLELWLARGSPAELDAALVRIAGRAGASGWELEVRGDRPSVRYVREVAGAGGGTGQGAGVTDAAGAAAAVDAAATAGCGLLLLQPAGGAPRIGLVRPAAGSWAVLAIRPGIDPCSLLAAGRSSLPAAPPAFAPPPRRARPRLAAAGLVGAAVAIAAIVAGTVASRQPGGGAPAVAGPSASPSAPARVLANPGLMPSALPGSALAFDRHHGVGILVQAQSVSGQTWTWGGRYWSQARPDSSPGARAFAGLAFDPRHGDMVLVGGAFPAVAFSDDTWIWDGTTWTEIVAAGPQPAPDSAPLLAEESPADARAGGDGLLLVDAGVTWSWNGQGWRQRSASSPQLHRGSASIALDSASQSVILVGDVGRSTTAGTWRWSGDGWTALQPLHRPPAALASAMATDPVTGHLVLTVGDGGGSGSASETWTWDGDDWTPRGRAGLTGMPVGLLGDSAAGVVVAVVGDAQQPAGANPLAPVQTLAWTGTAWAPIASALDAGYDGQEPAPRTFAASAVDPQTGQVLLVGGQQFGSDAPLNPLADVWTWTGVGWRPQPAGPPARAGPMTAPDPHRGVIVVGGSDPSRDVFFSDAWRWADGSWSQLPAPAIPAGGLVAGGMATDQRLGSTVLLGACCAAPCCVEGARPLQTWTWDGSAWTLRHPAHSPPATGLLVDDAARGRILALVEPQPSAAPPDPSGKASLALATWVWDGGDWHDLGEEVLGPVRGAAADPVTGDVVALGDPVWGSGGTQLFDGRSWLRRALPDEPDTVVAGSPVQVDPRLGRLTVLSGPAGQLDEEWMWTGLAWIQLDLSAPAPAIDPGPALFRPGGPAP